MAITVKFPQGTQDRQAVIGANKIMAYTDEKIAFFSEVEQPDSAKAKGSKERFLTREGELIE
ncbi:MAG TPA: hypothetical protein DCP92_15995 [Nitrospiraceae bacterium]|jgi:predicted lipoprotein|nr:hypothetical protein [Nitrospiraceae bacterium]